MNKYIILESKDISVTFSERQFVRAYRENKSIYLTLLVPGSTFYSDKTDEYKYNTIQEAMDNLRFLYNQLSDNLFTEKGDEIIPVETENNDE